MQKSEKFFIFSWKELLVIGLLVFTIVGFFFTLGLHYGKNLHPIAAVSETPDGKLEASPETVPSREALDKGAQATEPAAADAIKSATEAAVAENNLKVEQAKPVDLPKEVEKEEEPSTDPAVAAAQIPAEKPLLNSVIAPKFAVQLGSYTSKKEAQQKIAVLTKRGLRPEIRTAEVNQQTRYRVVLPGFKTRGQADLRGKELKTKRKIENFVVIKAN
jgi:cell division protein FtsN